MKKAFPGYIKKRKRQTFFKTIVEFGIVAALLAMGIVTTGERLNLLTVVAILGCLPASKAMVEWIMILPHHSIAKEKVEEIENMFPRVTKTYDLVLTSEKNIMPLECLMICGSVLCAYTTTKKVSCTTITEHIKKYIYASNISNVRVYVFDDYLVFLKNAKMKIEGCSKDIEEQKEKIQNILIQISL